MSIRRNRQTKIACWSTACLCLVMSAAIAWRMSRTLPVSSGVNNSSPRTNPHEKPLPRIITLAPHLTEWMYELGAGEQIIATVEHSDFPEPARALPRIGNAFTLNLEKIIASRPDLVIYWSDGGGALQVERLSKLGVPVLGVQINTLEELPVAIGRLCDAVRCPQSEVEQKLQQRISRLQYTYREHRPFRTFIQIGNRPLWTLGGGHLLSSSLEICGSQNLFASISSSAAVVSPEQVVAGQPDVIVLTKTATDSDWEAEWDRWWPSQNSHRPRYIIIDPDISLRPGPRIFEAIEKVCGTQI